MNILANVLAFGLALSPGNPLFDVVSVELDRIPVQATSLTSTATPASANWVAPNASAASSATATATPAAANWVAPNASASSSATANATPASAPWVAPNAQATSAATATATPAYAVWVAPNATSSMQLPADPREIAISVSRSATQSISVSRVSYSFPVSRASFSIEVS
jgi:hypothetical protein